MESPPPNPAAAPPPPPALEEQDYVLQAQMAFTEFVFRYWKYGGYALGAILLGSLVYGGYTSWMQGRAEDRFGAIADIDHRMPQIDQMAMYGLGPTDDPADATRTANLEEGARRYEGLAKEYSGSAAVVAWLRAEQAWTRAGKPDAAREAAAKAAAVGGKDAVAFAADTRAVAALVDTGKGDDAEAKLREMSGRYSGFFAEQALIRLAGVQLDAGKADAAAATYAEIETRFPTSLDIVALGELAQRLGKPAPKAPSEAAPSEAAPGKP